jgi:TRAP transporter TAXI family solute receptor
MTRLKLIGIATAAALLLALPAAAQTRTMAIGTGGTGGIYYPLGGGIANLLSKTLPGMQVTAEVTGGAIDNIRLMASGQNELGMISSDAGGDAVAGRERFKEKVPLRALVTLYSSPIHVVTIEGTGIARVSDLKGRRISGGAPGSATETQALRILEAAGLDRDRDVKRERLSVAESAAAIKDRKIDAFFWGGGVPTAAVTDLAATPGTTIRLLDVSDLLPKITAKYGTIFGPSVIRAGSYPGLKADVPGFATWNTLMATDKMPDDLAYAITRAIFEGKSDLVAVHKEAENIDLAGQTADRSPAPYHPGALRYLKEKGITP